MAMTMTQKLLARKAGLDFVEADQLISCRLDLMLGNDITAPVAIDQFNRLNLPKTHDPEKIVLIPDHFTPNKDIKSAALNINAAFEAEESEFLLPILKTEAYMPAKNESLYYDACDDYEKIPFTLIPYFAFANRGESEMQVWLLRRG